MTLVADLQGAGYEQEIGLGVYDIHSPQVPPVAEMEALLRRALTVLDPSQLWVNPDCGLKTRGYDEVRAALRNLVAAARAVRERLGEPR
jgi:5-methyltetrahydropteroyltriglutamate--homocysteine methyltransferase